MHNSDFMKVQPFKIAKPIQTNLIVQVDKGEVFYNQLHEHEEIQISHIVSGSGKLIVANSINSFSRGDVFVIAGNTPHLFQSTLGGDPSHMVSVFFTKSSFGQGFFEIPELAEVKRFFHISGGGFRILSKKRTICQTLDRLPDAGMLDRFVDFLKLIKKINGSEKSPLAGFVHPKKISKTEGRRLQQVFDHVMNNFEKEITLGQVAKQAHMTPHAFCRFFKKRTNKTFFQFLIELRLEHACQMLVAPVKIPIAEISEKSGFSSISNFNRKFKRAKNTTPSMYRKRMKVYSDF